MPTVSMTGSAFVMFVQANTRLATRRKDLKEHVASEEAEIKQQEDENRRGAKRATEELKGRKVKLRLITATAVQCVHAEDPNYPYWESDSTGLYSGVPYESEATIDHIGYEILDTLRAEKGQTFLAVRWPNPDSWCYKVPLTPENAERIELLD